MYGSISQLKHYIYACRDDKSYEDEPEEPQTPVVEGQKLANILQDDFHPKFGRTRLSFAEAVGYMYERSSRKWCFEQQFKAELKA